MYPSAELTDAARRKAALRRRISVNRLRCATLAGEVARPLGWLDRVIAQWQRIPPFAKLAALPLGLLFKRAMSPGKHVNLFGRAMRLLPVVMSALKLLKARRR